MSDCLLVLNPRHIPECIRAIDALDIDTCWLSYMTEPHVAEAMNYVVKRTAYDRYVVLSDDTLPTQAALDTVLETDYAAVTGYCNLDENEYNDIVNLTSNPLPPPPPKASSYHFMLRAEVEAPPRNIVYTTFAGLSLTMLDRDLLLDYPFEVTSLGGQMDYSLSYRLQQAGIPIVAPVGAFVHHVKERWSRLDQNPAKRLLVGEKPSRTSWSTPTGELV